MDERILVVHEEEAIIRHMRPALERQGYQVRGVTSSAEAVGVAGQYLPDLLIVYENLPDMSGPELIAHLRRQRAAGSALPAILIRPGLHRGDGNMRAVRDMEYELTTFELPQPFNAAEAAAFARRLLSPQQHQGPGGAL